MADPEAVGPAPRSEGSQHLIYLRPPMTGERPFARILVTRVWRQRLGDMMDQGAWAEGYPDRPAFFEAFRQISCAKVKGDLEQVRVYAVEFQVVETFAKSPGSSIRPSSTCSTRPARKRAPATGHPGRRNLRRIRRRDPHPPAGAESIELGPPRPRPVGL